MAKINTTEEATQHIMAAVDAAIRSLSITDYKLVLAEVMEELDARQDAAKFD